MKLLITALMLALAGCADGSSKDGGVTQANNGGNNNGASGDFDGGANNAGGFEPEVEEEFEFAHPAVVDARVFVANETLNSVAVIDSRSLAIRTVPVGFAPTRVVGPVEAVADSRVFVLNSGSSTVSVLEPDSLETVTVPVLRRANELAANPDGTWAIAWFDDRRLEEGEAAGDLSGATAVRADGTTYALAVGFRIERVAFTADGRGALLLSDDGVSVVEIDSLTSDTLLPPVAVLPASLQRFDRTDREVVLSPDGQWTVARVAASTSVTLTQVETSTQWVVDLPVIPTDLDWLPGTEPRVLGMLPGLGAAFVATVPDGLIAASELFVAGDMGGSDAGTADAGPDVGGVDSGGSDMTVVDMDAADGAAMDMATGDTSAPDAGDAENDATGDVATADMGPSSVDLPAMPAEGFSYIRLEAESLGAAEVSSDGSHALVFSTLNGRKTAVLIDLSTLEQRTLGFEKGVRGALGDDGGRTFIVLHTREEGEVPAGSSPSDPAYIARSWGLSIVDVASGATRLVLTEQEPGDATLWRGPSSSRMFMIFRGAGEEKDSMRDVLRVDLTSFSTDTFRVPSLPEGIGRVDEAQRIYVNQQHPQGRITFVDAESGRRQTVTGYQLNSGID